MKTQRYRLRLTGLQEAEGHIRAASLVRVLEALVQAAERATSLLAVGESRSRGRPPGWLKATADLVLTGLEPGSTVLQIEAPCLGETAHEQFAQQDLWRDPPNLEDTALDLVAYAIHEAKEDGARGERFDSGVLGAIVKLGSTVPTPEACYELIPRGSARGRFALDGDTCGLINRRLDTIPKPRAFVVSGKLEAIQHAAARFRIVLDSGQQLLGRLESERLEAEMLRPLWGKPTTVEGIVQFKINGEPRLVEARKISASTSGDKAFAELPTAKLAASPGLFPELKTRAVSSDSKQLWGAWPGDEPIEDLMAELD